MARDSNRLTHGASIHCSTNRAGPSQIRKKDLEPTNPLRAPTSYRSLLPSRVVDKEMIRTHARLHRLNSFSRPFPSAGLAILQNIVRTNPRVITVKGGVLTPDQRTSLIFINGHEWTRTTDHAISGASNHLSYKPAPSW